MEHNHNRLNIADGQAIQVYTQIPAHVLIMDDANYESFFKGEKYVSQGGEFLDSQVTIKPPSGGWWNVVVHLAGKPLDTLQGNTKVLIKR